MPSQIKTFSAAIEQVGTNDPTITILNDTIGGNPIPKRIGVGASIITNTGKFPYLKTRVTIDGFDISAMECFSAYKTPTDNDHVTIITGIFDGLGGYTQQDNRLGSGHTNIIKIEVYP